MQMSLTIQQIVLDAKNLAVKLKEANSTADNLLSQGQNVHGQIDIMKQVISVKWKMIILPISYLK